MHKPLDQHFKSIKCILRYFQATLDYGISFTTTSCLSLVGYSNANWGTDLDDRRSSIGFCLFLGANPVSWGFRKQHVVSRSTTEAKYKSLTHAAAEVTWLESFLFELQVKVAGKAVVWCDNSSAMATVANPVCTLSLSMQSLICFLFEKSLRIYSVGIFVVFISCDGQMTMLVVR